MDATPSVGRAVAHSKRLREGTASGQSSLSTTPKQLPKKARTYVPPSSSSGARRSLSLTGSTSSCQIPCSKARWSEEEIKALVKFVTLKGHVEKWPAFRISGHHQFWTEASGFITTYVKGNPVRSAEACRNRVMNDLVKKFSTPEEACVVYFPPGSERDSWCLATSSSQIVPPAQTVEYVVNKTQQLLLQFNTTEQLQILSSLYQSYALSAKDVLIPLDFLSLSIEAMINLKHAGRTNVLYKFAKATGTMRDDGSDTLLPVKRLPLGLLEHCVNFFTATYITQVECPADYKEWLVSMFCLFGTKWVKLFSGPMWSVSQSSQTTSDVRATSRAIPTQARVNIPGLSERTLERYIASSGISMGSEVQLTLLDAAANSNPGGHWWLKGDGCDLVSGLGESVRLEWSGDVDMDTGELQQTYTAYRELLNFINEIGLGENSQQSVITVHLGKCLGILRENKQFILRGLTEAENVYREKQENRSSEKLLFEAGWKLEELNALLKDNQRLIVEVQTLRDVLSDDTTDLVGINVALKVANIRGQLTDFTRRISRQKRTVATHIFVMMISCEQRSVKPYAIPIQCIPYFAINESTMRRLISNILSLMKDRGMKVAGFTSNGEYNSMRNRGYTRPLSVFQIRSNVRTKYSRLSKRTMLEMLSPKWLNWDFVAKVPNPAVSSSLLVEIFGWQSSGLSWTDIISRLRPRTVPAGYPVQPWRIGEKETEPEMLRSILSQLEFSYTVRKYDTDGIPFCSHLHVPETHPVTGETFCEREDPAHVLKRIAKCTRNGGPKGIKLERFNEALQDKEANLTYSALVGSRKQSVQDAERLLSSSVARFMEEKGYHKEAEYIRAVNGWRRACDERGLSELQRSRLNYAFFNYILDDLMPWHISNYDFSLLEVNRDVRSVCGFTREVLVALVADIETTEWRRLEICQQSLPPEHPRASTTDDVECFFSVMRDMVGKNFTLKQVKYGWRKVCLEFQKRINPDLPYYYFTSSHDRYYEGERPCFNDTPTRTSHRTRRIPRIEASMFVSGRATLPVRGTQHVRAQFHNLPLDLPPPPSVLSHVSEHSYAQH